MGEGGARERSLGRLPIVHRERMPPQCWSIDTWKITACTELTYVDEGDSATVTVKLVTDELDWISLRLLGVKTLVVPPMTHRLWLPELEISHVRADGWEGIGFTIESARSDGGELRCHCESIEYVSSSWH